MYSTDLTLYESTGAFAAIAGIFSTIMLIAMVITVINIVANVFIYRKAGYAGWEAIVPIYNIVCLANMVGMPGWIVVFAFIPFVNFAFIVIAIIMRYRLYKCFGMSTGFAILGIFFGTICSLIIAFNKKCDYQGVV